MRWSFCFVASLIFVGCYITERGQVQSAFDLAAGDGGGSSSRCGTATCSGCCTAEGSCAAGNVDSQCGAQGAMCSDCRLKSATCGVGMCSPPIPVVVRGETRFLSNDGRSTLSFDQVALWVVQGDGGFFSVPKQSQQGAVAFAPVPRGERYLFTGDLWVFGVGTEVDLSQSVLERSGVTLGDAGLSWTMTTNDVSAFPPGTNLQVYAPSLGLWVERYQRGAQVPLGSSTTIPFDHVAAVGGSLVPIPEGDILFLSAMTPLDAGAGLTAQLATAMGSTRLELLTGVPGSATVGFSSGRPVSLVTGWHPRAFFDAVSAFVDPGLPQQYSFAISALPFAVDAGSAGSSGDLLIIDSAGEGVTSDVLVNVRARSVFPTDWPLVATASFCAGVSTQRPDAGALTLNSQVCVTEQSFDLDLRPSVPPAVDIALDGTSVIARPFQQGSTPRVSATARLGWNQSGPVGSWEVRSFTFDGARWRRVATLVAPGTTTSLLLPPGFLTPGQPAALRLLARRQTGVETMSYRSTFPWGTAEVSSGVFDVR